MKRRDFIKGSAILGASIAIPNVLHSESGMLATKTGRKIFKILNADKTTVGTLPILRAFAGDHLDHVSPYVLFDEFGPVDLKVGNAPLRVDAHPHAGIIPTTYFLSGSGHHRDSLNYDFQVGKGEFMMFSSGKGAVHMEETGQKMFDEGGICHGFQIWLNMPAKYKFSDPSTDVHKDEKMPVINNKNYTAKIVLGELFGIKSKIELISPAFYYHLKMNVDCRLDIPTDPQHNAFIYVVNGEIELEERRVVKKNQIALYQRGESVVNIYSKANAEILLLGGQPLNEPVYSYGPFVMNTEAQIKQCILDYQTGKMGDPELVNAKNTR